MKWAAAFPALITIALLPLLAACTQPNASTEPSIPTPQPTPIEIIEIAELQPYREASVKGDTAIVWVESSGNAVPASTDETTRQVQAAIRAEATRLSQVDYAKLSIPNYITVTQTLKLTPADFTAGELRLDATGMANNKPRWSIYAWQGPEIPQLPDRTIVFRWITVYALYDLQEKRVARLVATVRGEVHE